MDHNRNQNDYNDYNNDHHQQQDSSNYLHSEDIPFDRSSMGFTEVSPRQGGGGGAAAVGLDRERHGQTGMHCFSFYLLFCCVRPCNLLNQRVRILIFVLFLFEK